MTNHYKNHIETLSALAYSAMIERGLKPEFGVEALNQLKLIQKNAVDITNHKSGDHHFIEDDIQDQTDLLWCSIDNDDSLIA